MPEYPTFSGALYDCATKCAFLRSNKKCLNDFSDPICSRCRYYIGKYINADPRHMELFMLQAEQRASAIKATSGNHHFVFAVLIGLCLLFAWSTYTNEKELQSKFPVSNSIGQNKAVIYNPTSQHEIILSTLYKVAEDINKKVDVNKDGKTNCIDAAVLFYKYYPDKEKVCIEINQNNATGFNHLFNCVLVNGVWRAIEPQAAFGGHSEYYMRDVWVSKYDSSMNRDVTSEYIRYVK